MRRIGFCSAMIGLGLVVVGSTANAQSFGATVLHGVKVVSVLKGQSRDVAAAPRLFPDSCMRADQSREGIQQAAASVFESKVNERLQPQGFWLSRVAISLQPIDCENAAQMGGPGRLNIVYRFARSHLTFSVNTRQDGVPRADFSADFDLTARAVLVTPSRPPFTLGVDWPTITIENISYDSQNATADVVKAAIDALKAVSGTDVTAAVTQSRSFSLESLTTDLGRLPIPTGTQLALTVIGDQAVLTVSDGSTVADPRCINGYVWRQARADDLVCVTPQVRSDTVMDNRLWMTRTTGLVAAHCMNQPCLLARRNEEMQGPTTPRPCLNGFVFREAYAGDYYCVTPQTRAQAKYDNSQSTIRRADYRQPIK